MKKEGLWVRDIVANGPVTGVFLGKEKKLLAGRTGKPYLLLKLVDRTGEVEARIWDRVEALGSQFRAGDLVWVRGEAITYQGVLQVKVHDLRPGSSMPGEARIDFVPGYVEARQRSEARYWELLEVAQGIEDDTLRALVLSFLEDPELREGWLTAPAAKRLHHARVGGLLEHTLSVCRLVLRVWDQYPELRRDLLLAGAVLHDMGKIRELQAPWSPDYTTEGRLLGHVVIGVEMLDERLASYRTLPEEEAMGLKHLVLSHHGQFEYGSPRRPKTLEALVLHMLDDLDAKFDAFHSHLRADEGQGGDWTSYHPLFERYLYRGRMPAENAEEDG